MQKQACSNLPSCLLIIDGFQQARTVLCMSVYSEVDASLIIQNSRGQIYHIVHTVYFMFCDFLMQLSAVGHTVEMLWVWITLCLLLQGKQVQASSVQQLNYFTRTLLEFFCLNGYMNI